MPAYKSMIASSPFLATRSERRPLRWSKVLINFEIMRDRNLKKKNSRALSRILKQFERFERFESVLSNSI